MWNIKRGRAWVHKFLQLRIWHLCIMQVDKQSFMDRRYWKYDLRFINLYWMRTREVEEEADVDILKPWSKMMITGCFELVKILRFVNIKSDFSMPTCFCRAKKIINIVARLIPPKNLQPRYLRRNNDNFKKRELSTKKQRKL